VVGVIAFGIARGRWSALRSTSPRAYAPRHSTLVPR
jgi:hypothetical protein